MTRRRQNGTRWNNKKAHTWKPGSYYGTWPNDAKIHHVEFEIFLFCGIGLDKVVEEVWHNPDNSKSSLAIERLQVRALRRSRPAGSMVEYSTTVKGLFSFCRIFAAFLARINKNVLSSLQVMWVVLIFQILFSHKCNQFSYLLNTAFYSLQEVSAISPISFCYGWIV